MERVEKTKTFLKDHLDLIILLATLVGTSFWNHSEARQDYRHHDVMLQEIQKEMKDFQNKMHDETKDFHGRLCAIEERGKK